MNLRNSIKDYFFIALGSVAMAIGVVGFLSPNKVATGGTAGLAILLNNVLPISIGLWMAFINIPLLIVGLKKLGKEFAFKTVVCIAFIILFIDLLAKGFKLPALSDNLMLATLYGGICVGVGLGLIFKGGASAGGATIIAKILNSKFSVKSSNVILILDSLVVVMAGVLFKSIELALWSLISIYTTTKLIDTILVGASNQKIIHISSTKNLHELSKIISNELGVSGTIIKGNDLQISEYKDIIFLMIDKGRLSTLKQIALQYDSNVRMIVIEASEVLG